MLDFMVRERFHRYGHCYQILHYMAAVTCCKMCEAIICPMLFTKNERGASFGHLHWSVAKFFQIFYIKRITAGQCAFMANLVSSSAFSTIDSKAKNFQALFFLNFRTHRRRRCSRPRYELMPDGRRQLGRLLRHSLNLCRSVLKKPQKIAMITNFNNC